MTPEKKKLQGSEKRDIFKRKHKELSPKFYAMDVDLALIEFRPPGYAAFIDYKDEYDSITITEAIGYNACLNMTIPIPVYIAVNNDPETWEYSIYKYQYTDIKIKPFKANMEKVAETKTAGEWAQWESDVRTAYKKRIRRAYIEASKRPLNGAHVNTN